MLALPVRDLPIGNWLCEIKFDGYRALAFKADKEVRLISRNRNSFNDDYPVLVDSLKIFCGRPASLISDLMTLIPGTR
jgi:bifunctional non-homologous end joining protein LigD